MSTAGFFSVTLSTVEPDKYQFRARERADLVNLIEKTGVEATIIATPQADYPFRFLCDTQAACGVITWLVAHVDYSNFKHAVGQTEGQQHKEGYYCRVWAVLKGLEMKGEPHSSWAPPPDLDETLPLFDGHLDYPAIEGDDKPLKMPEWFCKALVEAQAQDHANAGHRLAKCVVCNGLLYDEGNGWRHEGAGAHPPEPTMIFDPKAPEVPPPAVVLDNPEQRKATPERRKKLIKTATYRRAGKVAR